MLIVIEGLDGSGKSTQVKRLRKYLESLGRPLKYITFSADSALYREINSLLVIHASYFRKIILTGERE